MVETYSHSRLWLFENCPEYYKLKYIDKTISELPISINVFLGGRVHKSLEWFYNKIKENETPSIDNLVFYFITSWKENFPNGVKFREMETEKDFFNQGIKFLIDYYQKNKPFLDNTIHVEKKIIFPLDENHEYFIQGYIDRVVLNQDNEYEVHDYKTNSFLKSREEIDSDRQLAFYHLGLQQLFGPEIKVKLIWHFLSHNKKIISARTNEQLKKLKQETLALIKKIESTTYWPACNKPWCDWCCYKREKGLG